MSEKVVFKVVIIRNIQNGPDSMMFLINFFPVAIFFEVTIFHNFREIIKNRGSCTWLQFIHRLSDRPIGLLIMTNMPQHYPRVSMTKSCLWRAKRFNIWKSFDLFWKFCYLFSKRVEIFWFVFQKRFRSVI